MNQSPKSTNEQNTNPSEEAASSPPPMPEVHRGTDGHAYAVVDGRSVRVDSAEFRRIARYELLAVGDELPTPDQVRAYLDQLLARAHRLPPKPTYLRVCQLGNRLVYDLANATGEVVEIDADGCRILTQSPVHFIRPAGTEAMPTPQFGQGYSALRRFIRLPETAFCLFIAHLTYQFCDGTPQPIMVFAGEQGRSKTTVAKMVQMLADPRQPAVRQLPPSCRDLMVSARHARLLSYDNVSLIRPALSDALCSLSTGGGYGLRTGHTDTEETRFDALRPITLGGIGNFVVRDDLRDRCVFYELEPINDKDRLAEGPLWKAFRLALPGIVGGLFDLCSQALGILDSVKPETMPRMADFYRWALAVEQAAGWADGTIDSAYRDQRAASDVDAMEADLVVAVSTLLNTRGSWVGPAQSLLEDLRSLPGVVNVPRSAAKLGSELQRLAPLLRRNGIDIENQRTGAARKIILTNKTALAPSQPSLLSPAPSELPQQMPSTAAQPAADDGCDSCDGGGGLRTSATRANIAQHEQSGLTPAVPAEGTDTPDEQSSESQNEDLDEHDGDVQAGIEDGCFSDEDDDGEMQILSADVDAEVAMIRPPALRSIYRVLQGKQLGPSEVLAALQQQGTDNGKSQRRVRKLLVLGTNQGVFQRTARGTYTC